MSFFICDLGSYSLKFAWTKVLKKNALLGQVEEVIYPDDIDASNYLERIQYLINYLNEKNLIDSKICLNIADHLITSRYITIPVANKKKALQMLPFQLDEQLPLPIDQQHYATFVKVGSSSSKTISQIINKNKFNELYQVLDQNNFFPTIFSSNLFFLNSNFFSHISNGAIIDIGHQYTHLYAIKENNIISDEIFHYGGQNISEMISQVYDLNLDETNIFKHRNSFFLTKLQYQEADNDQKDFAKLMEKVTESLLTEINRWRLSVRVNSGLSIDEVYLTGGTSQIKNISEYLQEQTGVKFFLLNKNIEKQNSFNLENCAKSLISKNKPPNFLTGSFSSKNLNELPLENLSLIFSRSLIYSIIVILFLLIDTFVFIKPEIKIVNKKLNKLLKRTSVKVTRKDKRILKRRPILFYKKLSNEERKIKRKLTKISKQANLLPLEVLNKLSSNLQMPNDVYLEKFITNGEDVRAQFKSDKIKNIEKLQESLKSLNYNSIKIRVNKSSKLLNLKYRF